MFHIGEAIKIKVKEISILYLYSKQRNLRMITDITFIENQIKNLDEKIAKTKQDNSLCNTRAKLKNDLDHLYRSRAYGNYIRSRAKWIEEGEKSSSYFLGLEKGYQTNNVMYKVKCPDGNTITNPSGILKEREKFYSDLYKSKSPQKTNIDLYLQNCPIPKLTDTDSIHCENLITKEECEKAIKQMKANKALGLDGLSVEFYRVSWSEISDILVDSYREAFNSGKLSNSQNLSVLSLLYKKGDRHLLKNYRPISLSNVNYKILTFVLANRLQHVISKIVSTDQTGYIKKRYIGTNIRKILDTIEYTDKTGQSGVLLQLDFEKAFDSVEWSFRFHTLDKFNFGPNFIKWITIIYQNPMAIVKSECIF